MNSLAEAGVCLSGAGDLVGVVCACGGSRDSLGGDVCATVFCGVFCGGIIGAVKGFMAFA